MTDFQTDALHLQLATCGTKIFCKTGIINLLASHIQSAMNSRVSVGKITIFAAIIGIVINNKYHVVSFC
jgi:hypothetical protein